MAANRTHLELHPSNLFGLRDVYALRKIKQVKNVFWRYVVTLFISTTLFVLGTFKLAEAYLNTMSSYRQLDKTISKGEVLALIKPVVIDDIAVLVSFGIAAVVLIGLCGLRIGASTNKTRKMLEIILSTIIFAALIFVLYWVGTIRLLILILKTFATIIPLSIAIYPFFRRRWTGNCLPNSFLIITAIISLIPMCLVFMHNLRPAWWLNEFLSNIGDGVALISFGLLILYLQRQRVDAIMLKHHIFGERVVQISSIIVDTNNPNMRRTLNHDDWELIEDGENVFLKLKLPKK